MVDGQLAQTPKLGGIEVVGVLDTHRREPDFRGSATLLHVDVGWLHSIAGIEREAEALDPEQRRHALFLQPSRAP